MSVNAIPVAVRRKAPPPLEISSPVLTHASGIYSKASPDRSSLLMDLPSPTPFCGPSYDLDPDLPSPPPISSYADQDSSTVPAPISSYADQDSFTVPAPISSYADQDSSTVPVSRIPRHSCPDIRVYHNDPDMVAKDREYRARKMREFESLIESSKVLRFSITPECASP